MKERLDVLLVQKGFYPSREKAKGSIMAGLVFVNNQISDKPGMSIDVDAEIMVKQHNCPYVGRGGLKLEKAIHTFQLDLKDANAMDIGASTGGFTDCMLQNGAAKVYALDVGYGQLDYSLRIDSRVINMEKENIRHLDLEKIKEPLDFISIDVSFISLKLVFPVAVQLLRDSGNLVCLVKPQFEAGREQVGKKGIIKDKSVHREVIEKVIQYADECGLYPQGLTFSPMTGAKGNIEYLLHLSKSKNTAVELDVDQIVNESHTTLQS